MSTNASSQTVQPLRPWAHRLAASPWIPCFLFGGLCCLGLLHHEMWRDELRAWVLVQQSSSLIDLFQQINHEGHPALWYFCLYGITRLTQNPLAMQLFHGAIATTIIYVIHRYSPFTLLQRWLLTFSYFFFYEYAIVSRGYSLGVLCLMGFCSLFSSPQRIDPSHSSNDRQNRQNLQNQDGSSQSRHHQNSPSQPQPRNVLLLAGALALLANTTAYGLLLSLSLSLVLVWAWWQQRTQNSPLRQLRHGLGAFCILVMGWAIASFQVSRAMIAEAGQSLEQTAVLVASQHLSGLKLGSNRQVSDIWDSIGTGQVIPDSTTVEPAKRLIYSLTQIWKAYVPIPLQGQHHFWNTNFLTNSPQLDLSDSLPLGLLLSALLSLVLALLAMKALWRSRLAVCLYCFGTTILLLFSYQFAWWTSLRHHGHLFVFLVACFWLLPSLVPAQRLSAMANVLKRSTFLTVLLAIQMFAGIDLYVSDLALPFSGGKAAADYLADYVQTEQLENLTIAGYREQQASTVAIYLNQPFYYPETQRTGFSWETDRDRESDPTRLLDNLAAFSQTLPAQGLPAQTLPVRALPAQSFSTPSSPIVENATNPLTKPVPNSQDLILVWSEPLEQAPLGYQLSELKQFKSALAEDESFYLYHLSPQ